MSGNRQPVLDICGAWAAGCFPCFVLFRAKKETAVTPRFLRSVTPLSTLMRPGTPKLAGSPKTLMRPMSGISLLDVRSSSPACPVFDCGSRKSLHIRNPGWRLISYVHFAPEVPQQWPAHIRNPGWRPISYVHFISEKAPGR